MKCLQLFRGNTNHYLNKVVKSALFEYTTLFVIFVNSVVMAVNNPFRESEVLNQMELVFDIYYMVELLLKILALGLIFNKGTFFRSPANIFDFLVVAVTVSTRFANTKGTIALRPLRVFRVVMPLRSIIRIRELKDIISTLFAIQSTILDSILILILANVFFGIIGLELFSGYLKQTCVKVADGSLHGFCSKKADCVLGTVCGKQISSLYPYINFNTFGWSFILMFFQGSSEGWNIALYELYETTFIYSMFYYLPILFIGGFMLQNISVAIIKYEFTKIRASRSQPEPPADDDEGWELDRLEELPNQVFYETISKLKPPGLGRRLPLGSRTVSVGTSDH